MIKMVVIYIKFVILTGIIILNLVGDMPVYAENKSDMFSVVKTYALENSNKNPSIDIKVVDVGENIDNIINDKIEEKYQIALDNKNKKPDSSDENEDSLNEKPSESDKPSSDSGSSEKPNKYPDKESYFIGTTDFTNLSTSKRDSLLNGWSAIRDSYSKYDDNGEDNVTIIATAYTSAAEENGGWEGMNAIGGKLGPGCIAAPKDIPFQTKIRISGLGVFNVEDRGGAIVRISEDIIRIDVWMDSYREAMHFGKRVYKGRILK